MQKKSIFSHQIPLMILLINKPSNLIGYIHSNKKTDKIQQKVFFNTLSKGIFQTFSTPLNFSNSSRVAQGTFLISRIA